MTAFLFVPLLAATWIVGSAVASVAASFFLAILEASATPGVRDFSWRGPSFRSWVRDGIEWPEGTLADHFAKGVYLAYLVAVWGTPAVLLGRLAAGGTPWASAIAGAAFWLVFPVGLLSSLSSPASRWTPFRPGVLVAFARRPAQTLGFYLLSAPVLAVLVLTFDLVLVHTSKTAVAWSLALAPLAAVLFFVYAHLLGRLGLVVSFAFPEGPDEPRPKRGKRKRKVPPNAYDPRTRVFGPTEEIPDDPPVDAQPPDMRGIETPHDGVVTGYGVDYSGTAAPVEDPKPARIIHKFDDEDDEPIRVAPAPEVSADRRRVAEELANPPEREVALHAPSRAAEPANPYGADALAFLADPNTVGPWVMLTAGVMLLSLMQRGLDLLRPD